MTIPPVPEENPPLGTASQAGGADTPDAAMLEALTSIWEDSLYRIRTAAAVILEPWPRPRADGGPVLLGPDAEDPDADPALAHLGPFRYLCLVQSLMAPRRLPPLPDWCPPRSFWTQALAVGLVTAHLHREDPAAAYTTGFLHDAGIPLLAASDPQRAHAAHAFAAQKGITFADAWAACVPVDPHAPAHAAARHAATWNLPLAAARAALAPGAQGLLPARLRVARALVALRRMRAPADHADPPLLEADLKSLDLTPSALADLFTDLSELTDRARRLLPLLRQGN